LLLDRFYLAFLFELLVAFEYKLLTQNSNRYMYIPISFGLFTSDCHQAHLCFLPWPNLVYVPIEPTEVRVGKRRLKTPSCAAAAAAANYDRRPATAAHAADRFPLLRHIPGVRT
jgi:hypothetical protein